MRITGTLGDRIKSKLFPSGNQSAADNRCFRYLVVVVVCFIAFLITRLVPADLITLLVPADTAVFIGAFLAVMLTYLAKFITGIFETDRYEIPEIFFDRINHEITVRIGYYKTDTSICIGPIEDGKLKFVLNSFIIGMKNGVRISRPVEVGEPICSKEKIVVSLEQHKVAGFLLHKGEVAEINRGSFEREDIEITYDPEDKPITQLKDSHVWSAPSSGKITMYFDLPGYICKAYTLVGKEEKSLDWMDEDRTRCSLSYPMLVDQRIFWSIEKKQEEA